MQLSSAPPKIVLAFAADGSKNTIPVPSQIPVTPGAASYTDGFPPLTMEAVTSGGVPPSGLDFNGILNEMSAIDLWASAGAGFPFDAGFATAVGGYPKGSLVLRADGLGYWFSTIDNNSNNPDAGGNGWAPDGGNASASVYASAQQTLTVGSAKVLFDTVEFDSRGFWDSGNKRFRALYAGVYRLSGAVYLLAPGGQEFAAEVWKNGSLAKRFIQFPQVSSGDLTLPFDALISMAVGDYLEAFLAVTQSNVLAGVSGSNQPYVYGQLQFLGQ